MLPPTELTAAIWLTLCRIEGGWGMSMLPPTELTATVWLTLCRIEGGWG